jgi:hypothetical protein
MSGSPLLPANSAVDGERRKLAAHALLAARRAFYVRRGQRALLEQLFAARTATADDVRRALTLPDDIGPRCLGAVPGPLARAGIIRRVGFRGSERAIAHARPVTVWELADRAAAFAWRAAYPELPGPDAQPTLFTI